MFLWDETGYIMSKLAPFVKQYIRQSGKLANTDPSINEKGNRELASQLPYILILRCLDSNQGWRIQSPLPYHLATPQYGRNVSTCKLNSQTAIRAVIGRCG